MELVQEYRGYLTMANIRTIYGKSYDLDNPQDAAEVLRIQKQAQLKTVQKALSPNQIINSKKRMEAANLLAQNQAMENANAGVMAVAPTVEGLLRPARETRENRLGLINFGKNDNRPKKIITNAGGLLNLPYPPNSNLQLNQQTQNLLNNQVDQSSTPDAQPQPKRTLGQRASGLFDRASNAYMGAAPILAVAQEFQKAGALRPIGTPMQGDPYGKMMEIRQNRKEANNVASLRTKYDGRIPQELNDKDFVDTVKKIINEDIKNSGSRNNKQLIEDAKINTRLEENQKEGLGNAKSAFGAGSTVLSATGSIGEFTPYGGNFAVQTQKARSAVNANAVNTKQFFNNAASLGRIAKYTVQSINNLIPVEFASDGSTINGYKSEKKALEDYQNLRSFVDRTVNQLENQLLNPDAELTKAKKNDFVAAVNSGSQLLKEYDRLIGSLKGEIKGTDDNAGAKNRTYDPSLLPPDPNQTRESSFETVYGKGQYDIVANAMGVK